MKINKQRGSVSIITIVALAILVIGGGVYYATRNNNNDLQGENSSQSNNQTTQTENNNSNRGSLRNIMASTGSNKCTVRAVMDSKNSSEGTVYVSNGMMRGDFKATTNSITVESHMINDGKYMYTWSGNQGVKMLSKDTNPSGSENSNMGHGDQFMDMDRNVDYECSAWTKDDSMFKAPTNIKFIDVQDMMNTVNNAGNGIPQLPNIPNLEN